MRCNSIVNLAKKISYDAKWSPGLFQILLGALIRLCSVSSALAELCNSPPLQNKLKLLNSILLSNLVTDVGGQHMAVKPVQKQPDLT